MHTRRYTCGECPWLVANHGTRTPDSRYAKKNLNQLWGKLRRGTDQHICGPMTEDLAKRATTHPAGQVECPAGIALVYRELAKLFAITGNTGPPTPAQTAEYLANNPNGLTRAGIMHWTTIRPKMPPQLGGKPLPRVAKSLVLDSNAINRPRA